MPVIAIEVKKEIVEKVKQGEPVAKLAEQYGVSDRSIYAWLKKKATGSISVLKHNQLKRENQMLKEIVGVLTIELEKLKKKQTRN
jgi:transposase-like protein